MKVNCEEDIQKFYDKMSNIYSQYEEWYRQKKDKTAYVRIQFFVYSADNIELLKKSNGTLLFQTKYYYYASLGWLLQNLPTDRHSYVKICELTDEIDLPMYLDSICKNENTEILSLSELPFETRQFDSFEEFSIWISDMIYLIKDNLLSVNLINKYNNNTEDYLPNLNDYPFSGDYAQHIQKANRYFYWGSTDFFSVYGELAYFYLWIHLNELYY